MPTSPALWIEKDFEKSKDKLIDDNIEILQMYEIFILDDLIRFELFNIITEHFIEELNKYILWYNCHRIKKSLGSMSPMEYRIKLGIN